MPANAQLFKSIGSSQSVVQSILSSEKTKTGSFNPSSVVGGILREKDPIKKGRESDDSTLGERNIYKEVSLSDVFEVSQAIKGIFGGGKLDTFLESVAKLLGKEGSLDQDKNRSILADKNRPEYDRLPGTGSTSIQDIVLQDPTSPRAIHENQARIDATLNEAPRLSSKTIFGDEGLDLMTQQSEQGQQAIAGSEERFQGVSTAVENSGQLSTNASVFAKEAQGYAEQAQGRKASQDVLKDTAALAAKNSFILQNISAQQTDLAVGMRGLSSQIHGLNQQAGIQSQKLESMQVLAASRVDQLGSIINIQMHDQQMAINDKKLAARASFATTQSYVIPGLSQARQ